MTGAAKGTVLKLLADVVKACSEYQYKALRDLPCVRIQCDESWSYCHSKEKNVPKEKKGEFGFGDIYTWTAICADTKLAPTWYVGKRDTPSAKIFMHDLASRLKNWIQLTTDGFKSYVDAVDSAFGTEVDFSQLVKSYKKTDKHSDTRHSPAKFNGTKKITINGNPDPKQISTSYVERQT